MKPVTLVISGWGPYAGRETISFAPFLEGGLFLISGPTGAGKTTVFDAVSYALYGCVSGSLRDKNSVRSDFAGAGTETFVELTFLHRDKEYLVRRSPRYERPKKRGEGTVLSAESAVLTEEDGILTAGVREVNRRIEELLGLGCDQFRQISMIAQGEFLELLTASSGDRSLILRRLFQTEAFDQLGKRLSEQTKKLSGEAEAIKNRMDEAAGSICPDEGSELSELLSAPYRSYERIALLTEQLAAGQETEAESLREKERSLEERLQRLRLQLERGKQRQETKRLLREKEAEVEELERGRKTEEETERQAGRLEEEALELRLAEQRLAGLRPLLADADRLRKKRKETQRRLCGLEEKKRSCRKKREANGQEQQELSGKTEAQNGAKERRLEGEKALYQARARLLALNGLKRQAGEARESGSRLKKLQDVFERAEKQRGEEKSRYEEMEERCRRGAIGLAARLLKPGEPCPVCGSLHHPAPAAASGDVPGEEEVRIQKSRYEKAAKEYDAAYERAAAEKGRAGQVRGRLTEALLEAGLPGDCTEEALDRQIRLAGRECVRWETVVCEAQEQLREREKLKNRLAVLEQEQRALAAEEEKLEAERLIEKEALDHMAGELTGKEQSLPEDLKDAEALEQALLDARGKREDREKRARALREGLEARKKNWNRACAQCEELRRQLQETADPEGGMAALSEELDRREAGQRQIRNKREELLARLLQNRRAAASLSEKYKRYLSLEKKYGILKDLDNVTRGNNPERMVFEQYVLSFYFEEILRAANQRFAIMTGERYELFKVERVTDARTKDFLDLEVLDSYTGRKRSVKTLSGGEAFKAALSLAMGLSDIIQEYAGGIRVEVLFVDEGFGGLDTESLDQALAALSGIGGPGRMIGIISHVSELQERIPGKILVEKSNTGSRLRVET